MTEIGQEQPLEESPMQYPNGDLIQVGDEVLIERKHFGRVIASMDTSAYLPGEESWAYLNEGVMVQTDFAGLVHYTSAASNLLEFRCRPSIATPPTAYADSFPPEATPTTMKRPPKIVLHCPTGYRMELEGLVHEWMRAGVRYVGVVGEDASKVEDRIDEFCVGDGSAPYFMLTAFHAPPETLDDAIEFAERLGEEQGGIVQVIVL